MSILDGATWLSPVAVFRTYMMEIFICIYYFKKSYALISIIVAQVPKNFKIFNALLIRNLKNTSEWIVVWIKRDVRSDRYLSLRNVSTSKHNTRFWSIYFAQALLALTEYFLDDIIIDS